MFNFGNPEDTAILFWNQSLGVKGPALPDLHFEEMGEKDLIFAFTYLYLALRTAYTDGAADEVIEILTEPYDEVFDLLCATSVDFREAVMNGHHHYLPGWYPDIIEKYQGIAKAHSAD